MICAIFGALGLAEVRPQAAELSVEEIADAQGWSFRTAQRKVAKWCSKGWPRVRRETCRGNYRGRYLVDRESFDAYCEGDLGPTATAAPSSAAA
jgi:hypothetical protein